MVCGFFCVTVTSVVIACGDKDSDTSDWGSAASEVDSDAETDADADADTDADSDIEGLTPIRSDEAVVIIPEDECHPGCADCT